MRVVSSLGEAFSIAFTRYWTGLPPVLIAIISKAVRTTAIDFCFFPPILPVFLACFFPKCMSWLTSRSTTFTFVLENFWCSCLPPEWGISIGLRSMTLARPWSSTFTWVMSHLFQRRRFGYSSLVLTSIYLLGFSFLP